jgi:predicted amidophosphoribosyltransferase
VEHLFYIVVPHWLLVMLTIPLPTYWFVKRYRRARLVQAGLCIVCGYDLRATPERCPECGAEAPQAKQAKLQPADGAAA